MSNGSASLLKGDWYVKGDADHFAKIGVDLRDEETISRLLARAFIEGRAYQAREVQKALDPKFHTPWRHY